MLKMYGGCRDEARPIADTCIKCPEGTFQSRMSAFDPSVRLFGVLFNEGYLLLVGPNTVPICVMISMRKNRRHVWMHVVALMNKLN
jgi:hypothetical protein